MASLSKEGPKRWRIQWMDITGTRKRRQIRLHGVNRRQAESQFARIESIISTRLQGAKLDEVDAAWLGQLPEKFHSKLVKAGLVEPRAAEEEESETDVVTLKEFLDEFELDGLTAKGEPAADATRKKWRATMDYLIQHFGADRDISGISHDDAHQFRKWLEKRRIKRSKLRPKGQPLAMNSRRKHMDCSKVFFNAAKRRGLILLNPFEHQISSTKKNRSRDFFVTRDVTEKIIAACPDAEWKLLVALWRYAALRKMEVMWLKWNDVLWDQGKLRVHSTKTARHEGREYRYVPLRDIRSYLEDQYFDPETVDGPIINRFSPGNSNLDKPLKVILHRAGIVAWPKLFQNMRASCETDWLNEGHPAHVVAAWVGHSIQVQRESYAQITDGHFDDFNSRSVSHTKSGSDSGSLEGDSECLGVIESELPVSLSPRKNANDQCFSRRNRGYRVAVEGLEPPTRGL